MSDDIKSVIEEDLKKINAVQNELKTAIDAHTSDIEKHGKSTFYNRNRHINYTNVCALSCKFCSFYRKRGEAGAYEMPAEQVIWLVLGMALYRQLPIDDVVERAEKIIYF